MAREMPLAEEKRRLRRELAARRRAVEPEAARRAAEAVAALLLTLPEVLAAARVGLYAALPDELPSRPIFEALLAPGRALLLPRATPARRLEFRACSSWGALRPGAYGVLEPPESGAALQLGARDVVLVPGVAFDAAGHRLGRGKGYYDRTFAGPAGAEGPLLLGVGYEFQVVARVPHGERDRRLDAVVTERAVRRAGGSEAQGRCRTSSARSSDSSR
jgi:5-formyltetrahydrofolate cyclo-ligase